MVLTGFCSFFHDLSGRGFESNSYIKGSNGGGSFNTNDGGNSKVKSLLTGLCG